MQATAERTVNYPTLLYPTTPDLIPVFPTLSYSTIRLPNKFFCMIQLFLLHLIDIFPSRLETLLELSLRTTAANADPFKDDLRCVDDNTTYLVECLSLRLSLF